MLRAHPDRLTRWQATIASTTARIRRPKTVSVFCEHCQCWVKARRYNPVLYCCHNCEPTITFGNVSLRRTAQQAAELAHHLHLKRTHQWRRYAAHVTGAG